MRMSQPHVVSGINRQVEIFLIIIKLFFQAKPYADSNFLKSSKAKGQEHLTIF